jgi:hypothetical protein
MDIINSQYLFKTILVIIMNYQVLQIVSINKNYVYCKVEDEMVLLE